MDFNPIHLHWLFETMNTSVDETRH